jgi:GT2 family glycosyltransferase
MDDIRKISIIVITYNRPHDLLELARNIVSLEHTDWLEEVIIVNNNSSVDYKAVEVYLQSQPGIPFNYYVTKENLGVSGGRNFAIKKAKAPVLVFIDDDALFQNKDALLQVKGILSEEKNKDVGIVAFKVYYLSTLELQKNAFPHKEFESRKDWHQFDTYYFSGCAHAIRRELFEKVGYYPEDFFYGMEEYDLSYRAINSGFTIEYEDRVRVLHKESPEGRLPNREKLRGMWVNKTKVAWKYLPKKYYYSTAFLWSLRYLWRSGWHVAGWAKGWKEVTRISSHEQRNVLRREALQYLKKVDARLWY